MVNFLAVDEGLKRVLVRCNLLEYKFGLEQVVQGLLVLVLLHIINRVHLCLIAFDLYQRDVVDGAVGQRMKLGSRLARLLEPLQVVHSQAVGVASLGHCSTIGPCFPTRDCGGVLLHLHGVGPIGLALEDKDLEVLRILGDKLAGHWLLYVDVLLVLLLRLGELEGLAEAEHAAAAVLVVAPVIVVAKAVLILRGLDQEQDALLVRGVVVLSLCCFNHFYFLIKI